MLCADARNVGTMTSAFHTFAMHLLCSTHHSHIGLARFPQQKQGQNLSVRQGKPDLLSTTILHSDIPHTLPPTPPSSSLRHNARQTEQQQT